MKSVSKKPTRCIHRIEEAEPAITCAGFTVNSFSDVKGLTKDAILQEHNCTVTFKNVLEVAVSC